MQYNHNSSNTQEYYKNQPKRVIEFGIFNTKLDDNLKYIDNTISTTKYNIFSFLPKSLLLQFLQVANIYFLFISILSFFEFSPISPASEVGTFSFVLITRMIKEAIEDYQRYLQDKEINNKEVLKYVEDSESENPDDKSISFGSVDQSHFTNVNSWELRPGDIIKVRKEEEFTTDTLIILSSNIETGKCYIDTQNLDGETNLKEKDSLSTYDTSKSANQHSKEKQKEKQKDKKKVKKHRQDNNNGQSHRHRSNNSSNEGFAPEEDKNQTIVSFVSNNTIPGKEKRFFHLSSINLYLK